MKGFVHFIKEVLIWIMFSYQQKVNKSSQFSDEVSRLNSDGIYLRKKYFSREKCDRLARRIDDLLASEEVSVWSDESCADQRVYFANDLDEEMQSFYDDEYVRLILKSYLGVENPVGMVLAARINFNENNLGSGGGWHRDSPYRHQFKAIIYLNDVDEYNGPFQYFKKTHSFKNTLLSVLNFNFNKGQYRFTEDEVNTYSELSKFVSNDYCGEKGDMILVDTKGIHRGKPLLKGCRYALFCYFWDDEIPDHFQEYRQTGK